MADESQSAETPLEKDEQELFHEWMRVSSQDMFLQSLCRLVESLHPKNELEVGVTLTVGGMLVSGMLISAQRYFTLVEGQLSSSSLPQLAEWPARFRKGVQTRFEEKKQSKEPYEPNFVHLRAAKFYVPGQMPIPAEGALWRGRISAIAGVIVGDMKVSQGPK